MRLIRWIIKKILLSRNENCLIDYWNWKIVSSFEIQVRLNWLAKSIVVTIRTI